MTHRKRKMIVTIETFQRTTIRSRYGPKIARLERGEAEAPSEPATRLQNALEVLGLAGAGEICFEETERASPPICSDCLQPNTNPKR
jgi:hypothetical protein